MRPKTVIGIAGKARSGKDTVAGFIIGYCGGYQYSLAEPMRAMLKAGLGIDLHDPYWSNKKEDVIPAIGKSPRQLMQTLGTEWGRNIINQELWLVMANQVLLNRGPGMVISDIRYENEATWVRNMGGVVVHLVRPDATSVTPHSSENGVMVTAQDLTITNTGTLGDLQVKVKDLFGL